MSTFLIKADSDFLNSVRVYAEREKMSASEVFRSGAEVLMLGGSVVNVVEPVNQLPASVPSSKSVVNPVPAVNPLVEELRAKSGGRVIRASELGDVEIVNKPFGDVPSSSVGSSKFRGIKAVVSDRFDRLLEMSTEAGAKEILSMISSLEDRIDSL